MRALIGAMATLLVAGVACSASAGAVPRPDLIMTAGNTFGANGSPSGGGVALGVALMWPALPRLAFGVHAFADDIGQEIGRLVDPNDGTDLGAVAGRHRWTYGAAWRGDVAIVPTGAWTADASGTWGYYRLEDDVRGSTTDAASAIGFSLGLAGRRRLGQRQSLGLVARAHQLSIESRPGADRMNRYASLALEWRWRGDAQP